MRRAALLLPLLVLPGAALAQDSGAIVVTGTGLRAPPGAAAYGSVEVGRDRLARTASGRLEDALRDAAGVQTFRRSDSRTANPTAQGLTLRALGGNAASRALLLLDGVPQADPFTGFVPFAALAPERLARARVTRGGGSGPFGAGALAGVVELESAGPEEAQGLSGRGFMGSRGSMELSAGLVTPLGAGFVAAHGRFDRGDGFLLPPAEQRGPADAPSRYRSWSLGSRAVAPLGGGWEVQANLLFFDDRRRRGLPDADARSRGADASLRAVRRGRWGADALLYVQERGFSTRFVSATAGRTGAATTADQFATPALGLGGKLEVRPPVSGRHLLRIGVDARRAGGRTNELFRYQAGRPTRYRRAGGRTEVAGLFVEDDWDTTRALTLTGGARLDRWRIRDGSLLEVDRETGAATLAQAFPDRVGTRASFRAGALARASAAVALRAAAYTGFRLPTPNELYRPFRVGLDAVAANAELRPEALRGAEVGAEVRAGRRARLGLTLFDNRLAGAIGNVTLGAGPGVFPQVGFVAAGGAYRRRLNLRAIRARGAEATAEASAGPFRLATTYAFSDARVRAAAAGPAAALDGLRPAQSPRHAASATLSWLPARGRAEASTTLRHLGGQWEDDANSRRLPAATTLDAFAALGLGGGARLVARGENLAGARVLSGIAGDGVAERAQPRTLWLGLSFGG